MFEITCIYPVSMESILTICRRNRGLEAIYIEEENYGRLAENDKAEDIELVKYMVQVSVICPALAKFDCM